MASSLNVSPPYTQVMESSSTNELPSPDPPPAMKGPFEVLCEEVSSGDFSTPDLAAYLDQYSLRPEEQIKICRTYANYLNSTLKKRAKHQ